MHAPDRWLAILQQVLQRPVRHLPPQLLALGDQAQPNHSSRLVHRLPGAALLGLYVLAAQS